MNSLIKSGIIQELNGVNSFAYVVNDDTVFLPTEYKVLQSQAEGTFVKCMKLLYNGKVEFFYLADQLKPLSEILQLLDSDNFMQVMSNLLENIIYVKNNGFLSCLSIDLSLNHIYINPTTYMLSLVYLPLEKRLYKDLRSFENELRTCLLEIIQHVSSLTDSKVKRLSDDLANVTLSLENILSHIKGETMGGRKSGARLDAHTNRNKQAMKLVATNSPVPFEIDITKDEFVLGRKQELVDGVISFNKMIGRKHCKIIRQGNRYALIDLHSSNGTYVNKIRLESEQPCPIKDGDIVRLANSDFRVTIV